ncbi:MAG: GGDEF domain-containing protein [Duganella sp.]
MADTHQKQASPFAWLSDRRQRSKEEIILMIMCALSIPSILPFGLYRLWQGAWLSAAVDLAMVSGMLAVILHVWHTGRHRVASLGVTLFYTAGMLATIYLRGLSLVYWVYPTMIAAFFLLRPAVALAINSVSLLVLLAILLQHVEMLNLLTVVVTIALVNLFAYIFSHRTGLQNRELHLEAGRDFLTGAGNRRALDSTLASYAAERRPLPEACLLLLDLDHFKQVNDRHGHAAGDQVLRRLCDVLRHHTRATDELFRYGGEEFAIIANGAGLRAAGKLADTLRSAVAAAPLLDGHPITASIGVAPMPRGGSATAWLEQADRMLYAAKEGGRNAVRVAPDVA